MIHRTAVVMGVSVVVSHKQLVVELCLPTMLQRFHLHVHVFVINHMIMCGSLHSESNCALDINFYWHIKIK